MKIVKAGHSGVLIYFERADQSLLFDGNGQFSRDRARKLALRVLRALHIPCIASDFSLDAFLGAEEGLLFADGQPMGKLALFRFSCLDDLTSAAGCLSCESDASLYLFEGRFYLCLSSCAPFEAATLSEFGLPVDHAEETLSLLKERGRTLSTCHTLSLLQRIG